MNAPAAPRRIALTRNGRTVTVHYTARARRALVELRRTRRGSAPARYTGHIRIAPTCKHPIRDDRTRMQPFPPGDAGETARPRMTIHRSRS